MFYDFIEIGTSEFNTEIQLSSDYEYGISIEPLDFYLNKLPNKLFTKKECCAISDKDGEDYIFYIAEDTFLKYINIMEDKFMFKGCSSIGKKHPTVQKFAKFKNIDEDELITKKRIKLKRIKSIIDKYNVSDCFLLKVDTEGHDHIILKDFLLSTSIQPYLIEFEFNLLYTDEQKKDMIKFLEERNYAIKDQTYEDIFFYKNLHIIKSLKNKEEQEFNGPFYNYYLEFGELGYTFNDLETAKKNCILVNAVGIVYYKNEYILCSGDKLLKTERNEIKFVMCWLYGC